MSMPAKNLIKVYVENGIYHVYNRGVEKRVIYLDDQDHCVFLNCLKEALNLPNLQGPTLLQGGTLRRMPKNFCEDIELLAYCLMPNHFHLLIKQHSKNGMKDLLQSIMTRYVIYFNRKYRRTGGLFESHYKAILIMEESYLLHLSRYIHRNPLNEFTNLIQAYSSYSEYLGLRQTSWIKPELILSFFCRREVVVSEKD